LADLIVRRHPCLDEPPLDWYFRTALAAIQERRYASNRDRHQRLAWDGSFTPGAFRTSAPSTAKSRSPASTPPTPA